MRKKTNAEFVRQVQDLVGDSYVFLQSYKNTRTKLAYYHVDCGEVHYIKPGELKGTKSHKGRRCPTCATLIRNLKNTKTDAQWLKEVQDLTGDEYTFLEPYQGNHTPIYYYHKDCGKVRKIDPANFLSGHRCSFCVGHNIGTQEYKDKIKLLYGNEYSLLSDYDKSWTKVKIRHNKCGHEWWVNATNFIQGKSHCTKCSGSNGERLVMNYLDSLGLTYDYGYILPNRLHLDFYLADRNLAIEYDGIQHYKARELFGGEEQLKKQKVLDHKKDQYCKEHHIKLIRIPYTIKTRTGIGRILGHYIDLVN